MSSPIPSTPDRAPRKVALNRSFTLPAKSTGNIRNQLPAEIGAAQGIETLYVHPNSKVVKFTSASLSRPGSSAEASEPQGTLPWATLTEQTLAAGPLEIYHVPGSVAFLHSGSLLHAILPRSKGWCVDGVSKFAIRVLNDTYYRVELPGETREDLEKVEELKETLKQVLYYERTPCPFARTFTVELPEEPQVRRKNRRKSHGPAKKWKLEKAYSWKPEDGEEPPKLESEESSGSPAASDEDVPDSAEEVQSDASEAADQVRELNVKTPTRPSVRERARGLNMRSVTAPPQLALHMTPPSRLRSSLVLDGAADLVPEQQEAPRFPQEAVSTLDPTALRPFQSIPTDMPPSPPDSSAGHDHSEHAPRRALLQAAPLCDGPPPVMDQMYVHGDAENPGNEARLGIPPEPSGADHCDEKPSTVVPDGAGSAFLIAEQSTNELSGTTAEQRAGSVERELEMESMTETDNSQLASLNPTDTEPDSESQLQTAELHPRDSEAALVSAVKRDSTDPFAQIQARIQARRSIGGTTSFVPPIKSPTRQPSTSTASSSSSSSLSSASRRSHLSQQYQQQAFATALAKKACTVFLGPPAHLVLIMLRIAARFAKGAFPRSLMFESPAGVSKRVPGSFDLDGSDVEDFDLAADADADADADAALLLDEWDEDDFGVPLNSPVRLAAVHGAAARRRSERSVTSPRERRGWDGGGTEL